MRLCITHHCVIRVLSFMMILSTMLGAYVLLAPIMSRIEGRLFPVVVNFNVDTVRSNEEYIAISGTMEKSRSCVWLGNQAFVKLGSGFIRRLGVVYLDQPKGTSKTRPAGSTEFGEWLIERPTGIVGGELHLISLHRCHGLWITETSLFQTRANHDKWAG